MSTRQVIELIQARPSSDGDGVKLLRIFGGARPERFDPFLLMDEFGSESADDYIGGFPPHPHRGFETITYMLQGKMEHRDHMDNIGLLQDGDVQWMTAGKGVIHSEMPKQTEGKMRGFQIWLNLPADDKMQPAKYQDVAADSIPAYQFEDVSVKAIAGSATINGHVVKGYFEVVNTEPLYLDITLDKASSVTAPIADDLNTLVYVYEGEVEVGKSSTVKSQHLARLTGNGNLTIDNESDTPARVIVLAGKPIKEPIAQYGPFVMNTHEEIEQAVSEYREGVLTA